jgi:hypothetical protein
MVALEIFWTYFIGTMVVMRTLARPFHIRGKTITHHIRRKTNKEIHHFHFGFFFLAFALILIFVKGQITNSVIASAAIGFSLMADELFLLRKISRDHKHYFEKKGLVLSIIAHLIIGTIASILIVYHF